MSGGEQNMLRVEWEHSPEVERNVVLTGCGKKRKLQLWISLEILYYDKNSGREEVFKRSWVELIKYSHSEGKLKNEIQNQMKN